MSVEIRALESGEEQAVAQALRRHLELITHRARMQRDRDGVYLIAWMEQQPVGQALVRWHHPEFSPPALAPVPYVEDVYVPHDHRNQGVGSQLIAAAEGAVLRAGYRQIGLAVNVDNVAARRLYERLGYVDAGLGVHAQPWWHYDGDGHLHSHQEDVLDLIKDLPEPSSHLDQGHAHGDEDRS